VLPQQHRFTYNEPMPVESCTQSLCDLALRFGEDSDEAGMVSVGLTITRRGRGAVFLREEGCRGTGLGVLERTLMRPAW
jgi:hypothetical protein